LLLELELELPYRVRGFCTHVACAMLITSKIACLQSKEWFLIWIGSDIEKTFGKTISGLIENGIEPERRILWDTKKLKRPDTMKLLKDTYDSFGAEGQSPNITHNRPL